MDAREKLKQDLLKSNGQETGEWLDKNTPPDATVGVAEVGQIGFYARRYMTDYLGLLQPAVAALAILF